MKIKAIAPWFGSKRTLAPKVVEQLGPHQFYFEPFCGSASVLLAKPPSCHEVINDLHGELINLAQVLASDQCYELYNRLMRTLYCEKLLAQARSSMDSDRPADNDLERAYQYFVASWVSRNGCSGTRRSNYQIASRWTVPGGSGPVRFRSAVESIPDWHDRLRNVVILQRDAFGLLAKQEDEAGHAIYADPPYLLDTRSKSGNSGLYQHEFGDEDHKRLSEALGRFRKTRVVVSYYANPRLRELYPGWTVIDCTITKKLSNQNKRGTGRQGNAPEVLLVNGPEYFDGGEVEELFS